MKRSQDFVFLLSVVALLAFALAASLNNAMLKGYFRDENQFIASAALLAADGLLPYRDYAYFHMPNLVLVYALLTLSPQYPLDGGASIYPELAAAPFAWRVADYLPLEQRREQKLVGAGELAGLLHDLPPGGVLTGLTRDSEDFMLDYAQQNEYNPVQIGDDLQLWLP